MILIFAKIEIWIFIWALPLRCHNEYQAEHGMADKEITCFLYAVIRTSDSYLSFVLLPNCSDKIRARSSKKLNGPSFRSVFNSEKPHGNLATEKIVAEG
jgi:hypothetical protein